MKFSNATKSILTLGLVAGLNGAATAAECDDVSKAVHAAVTQKPTKVLVIVDEMISKNESCSCEVVKAAIRASEADKDLVREIVVTAVSASEGMAATIAECAVAEAPEAAGEIKAGLGEVFAGAKGGGGKSVVYDDGYSAKGGGKGVEVEDEVEDFGLEPIVISGVYLIAPSASASSFGVLRDRRGNIIDEDDIRRQDQLIDVLRRQAGRNNRRNRNAGDGGTVIVIGPSPVDVK